MLNNRINSKFYRFNAICFCKLLFLLFLLLLYQLHMHYANIYQYYHIKHGEYNRIHFITPLSYLNFLESLHILYFEKLIYFSQDEAGRYITVLSIENIILHYVLLINILLKVFNTFIKHIWKTCNVTFDYTCPWIWKIIKI